MSNFHGNPVLKAIISTARQERASNRHHLSFLVNDYDFVFGVDFRVNFDYVGCEDVASFSNKL